MLQDYISTSNESWTHSDLYAHDLQHIFKQQNSLSNYHLCCLGYLIITFAVVPPRRKI